MKNMVEDVLLCDCSSSEHQIVIRYFKDDELPDVYVDIHLVKRGFWYRIKYAIKYIFGYKSKYGAFDEMILGSKHISSLENVIKHIRMVEAGKQQLSIFDDGQHVNTQFY